VATCFTEVTLSVCPPPALDALDPLGLVEELLGLLELADDEAEGVPVICTSCPTCALSFDVSPVRL
jgi:hypothetical protein